MKKRKTGIRKKLDRWCGRDESIQISEEVNNKAGRPEGWMHGWRGGWKDKWMDGWMDCHDYRRADGGRHQITISQYLT
ncbi:hypothetical protein PoB_005005000 [Plakobranchus ocellatus]|uniref:Uncharacterized protein n=1 Tax=Plakobranchus ocellatus TaxID=259542 RepID=A0AAV4BSX7_9GAST|nr:hypothetical protein PoB_005005000 [Plakobranchus ocellatus]